MGCASSKQSQCQHCQAPYSPMSRRSISMNVHHPPLEKRSDIYDVVAFSSSTLDAIKLNFEKNSIWDSYEEQNDDQWVKNGELGADKSKEFTMGMIEAKVWSKIIDEKITKVVPRTPIRTPPGEPETIFVKELMEGLEDISPLRLGEHGRGFAFHVSADSIPSLIDSPRTRGRWQESVVVSPNKTIWFDSNEEESNCLGTVGLISKELLSEFDPQVISGFRKAFRELSPRNPCKQPRDGIMSLDVTEEKMNEISSKELIEEKKMNGFVHINGFVDRILIEEEKENLDRSDNGDVYPNVFVEEEMVDDSIEDENFVENKRVVLYFTTLRGVRKTYADCCFVRLILKGLGVRVDERDVSMHSGFKEELKELLGDDLCRGLPKVFVGDEYIGGVEEIRRLHEDGELEKVVEGCEMMGDIGGNLIGVCEACGDVRFVPCDTCSGSCKIYYEFEKDDEEYDEDEYGFQRCPDCNENGLLRCSLCCY